MLRYVYTYAIQLDSHIPITYVFSILYKQFIHSIPFYYIPYVKWDKCYSPTFLVSNKGKLGLRKGQTIQKSAAVGMERGWGQSQQGEWTLQPWDPQLSQRSGRKGVSFIRRSKQGKKQLSVGSWKSRWRDWKLSRKCVVVSPFSAGSFH